MSAWFFRMAARRAHLILNTDHSLGMYLKGLLGARVANRQNTERTSAALEGSALQDNMDRRFRTVRSTAYLVVVLSAVWAGFGVYMQEPAVFGIATVAGLGSAIAWYMVQTSHTLIARLIWYTTGLLAVLGAVFMLHPASNAEMMFVALLGGPFMTFSLKREKPLIIGLIIGILCAWIGYRLVGHDYFGPPIFDEAFSRTYLSLPIMLTVFGIIMIEMMAFGHLTDSYSEELWNSHQKERKANRAKSEFLAAMSHEIRTPMNGVIGMVEILENTQLAAEQRRILHAIKESSSSLLWIIDDILDVSKIEAGKMELSNAPMRLLPVVESVAETLRAHADQKGVELSLSVQANVPDTVHGDAGRLRQILLNLLGNAIKFSAPQKDDPCGLVSLRVQMDGAERIEFIVEDNGIGMDDKVQAAIFQPFERSGDVVKRMIQGNGLGLTIVKQLVEKMGGEVVVSSTLGEGSVFTLRLPIENASGPLKCQRLPGTQVVAMLPKGADRATWSSYALAADCDIKWVSNRDEFLSIARNAGPNMIFVLAAPTPQDRTSEWLRIRLGEEAPDAKLLLFSRDRTQVTGMRSSSNYAVQDLPILPSHFWDGLAFLSGSGAAAEQAPGSRKRVQASSGAARILVAEDNEINQAVFDSQLELLGHSSVIVRDGKECLEAWETGNFDLVLTDCQMPVMDGFELTRRLRQAEASEGRPRTPVIAVTANALEGEADRCLAAGMDDYLSKPVTIASLEKILKIYLPEAAYSANDVSDDTPPETGAAAV
ncbi:MAG: response regulator [Rhodobacteraceae bacterium]|nr:response regulator [Paracoccaceae bacterium]